MPALHRVASLLQRCCWGLTGTVLPQHLDYYIHEFTFRFTDTGLGIEATPLPASRPSYGRFLGHTQGRSLEASMTTRSVHHKSQIDLTAMTCTCPGRPGQ